MGKQKIYVLMYEGKPFLASSDIHVLITWLKKERQSTQIRGMGWIFTGGFTITDMEVVE